MSADPRPGDAAGSAIRLVCDDCGAVDAADGPVSLLTDHLAAAYGFTVRSTELTVFGLCRHCRA